MDFITEMDHFENIQSTNWQTVRFKPPPPHSPIGWRVEFRTMELQLTDFENAAFTVFVALLSRSTLFFDLNLYIPISKVDENLDIAHKRDACRQEKVYMRKHIDDSTSESDDYELMSMVDIICGKPGYAGMIPLVETYLETIKCDKSTRKVMSGYLDLIRARATGKLLTTAQWLRKLVTSHAAYKHDSNISEELNYIIIETCHKISRLEIGAPGLLDPEANDSATLPRLKRELSESGEGALLRGASFRSDFGDLNIGDGY
jgi:glutamate--cysteine ligase catalytic subunit